MPAITIRPRTMNGNGPRRSTIRPPIGETRIVVRPNVANVRPTSSTPPPRSVTKSAQMSRTPRRRSSRRALTIIAAAMNRLRRDAGVRRRGSAGGAPGLIQLPPQVARELRIGGGRDRRRVRAAQLRTRTATAMAAANVVSAASTRTKTYPPTSAVPSPPIAGPTRIPPICAALYRPKTSPRRPAGAASVR